MSIVVAGNGFPDWQAYNQNKITEPYQTRIFIMAMNRRWLLVSEGKDLWSFIQKKTYRMISL